MTRKAFPLAAAALAAGLAAQPLAAQDRTVHIFNWSDYIDESILKDFTDKTGIKVVYDVYDSNEILETKLLAGGSGYDVVVPTGYFIARQIQAGVFQKLDKDKLPNLVNMWDMVSERMAVHDPGNEYSINYMWGTLGIGYNKAKVAQALGTDEIDSWAVLFQPESIAKLADCGVNFLDSPTDIVPLALNYLGLDPNTTSAEDFARAEELLLAIRPYVRKFHSSEYINGLANGDICVAIGYSGDVFQAAARAEEAGQGIEVAYAIPEEGTQMWFDQMAIPADARNVEEAHEFLNFIMEPEVIARASNYVFYANGNLASQPFLDPEILNDPAIYPDEARMEKMFISHPYDARTQRQVTRMWTKIVTGQ